MKIKNPVSPSEFLLGFYEEYFEGVYDLSTSPPELLSVDRLTGLSDITGIPTRTLDSFVRGYVDVDERIAEGLSIGFGRSAESWLNLQKLYDENKD